jgi:hypothetical protein
MSELTPLHVLADLFDDGDLPVPNPEAAAEIVIQRLIDAGFERRPKSLTTRQTSRSSSPGTIEGVQSVSHMSYSRRLIRGAFQICTGPHEYRGLARAKGAGY